ncbi:hypothetical protein [Luteipulveratus mongoliensis]|uniref:DUF3515 domain-containing protein n=1 Tax=Luteipulveratus mongoliensis TaxID=571913 RepID=A0A0K1JGM6_9MICO|nr:hypothetical protein [Luteipulveratus mongoliensis]AKU15728.1 hypothetical protein VV02_07475 [Luteipulveratus mongoliensis]
MGMQGHATRPEDNEDDESQVAPPPVKVRVRPSRTVIIVIAAAALALVLAGCGSSGSPSKPAQESQPTPASAAPAASDPAPVAEVESEGLPEAANPVDIAKKIPMCELAPGAQVGVAMGEAQAVQCTIKGNDADPSSSYPGSEASVWVYTYARPTTAADSKEGISDYGSIILGPKFVIDVGIGSADAGKYDVTVEQIAKAVGGAVT